MTSSAPNTPRSRERRSRREVVAGALLVALSSLLFLWTPLVSADAALVPAQIGQRSTLTHVKPLMSDAAGSTDAAAEVVADTWSRYVPWAVCSRASIREGRLPLWNDLSGAGAPHFSNLDAAVLSPFTWPWYVLDVRAAAIVSALMRLFALGLFTLLFLLELRVAFAAAVAGAVAFQFAGVNVLGLLAPASAAAVLAPAGLFIVERMTRTTERAVFDSENAGRGRPGWGSSAALAAVIAATFLSGGFASFVFALLLVTAYAVARLMRVSLRERDACASSREVRRTSLLLLVGLSVGACIAAVQLLPWIGDLGQVVSPSISSAARASASSSAPALDVFPDLLGSPTAAFQLDAALRPDRRAVLAEHVGSFTLFLALLGACFAPRRRVAIFFALAAVGWLAAAHGLIGPTAIAAWPGGPLVPVGQGGAVFAFSTAVLAAFALDRVVADRRTGDARIAFAVVVLGACAILALRSSADTLASGTFSKVPEAGRVFAQMSSQAHVETVSAIFCAGLACVAIALAVRPGRGRSLLVLGAAAALFAQTAILTSDVNPLAPVATVYPRTDEMKRLVEIARGKQVLFVGSDRVEPDTHLVYGLHQLCASDPERTRRSDRLLRSSFGVDGGVIARASERALRLFGVGLVLEKNRLSDTSPPRDVTPTPGGTFASAEILPATPFVQRFVDVRGRGPLGFEWITNGSRNGCTFRVTLDDASTHERIVETTYPAGELRPHGQMHMPCSIAFPEVERHAGRKLVLTISSEDGVAGRSWSVACRGASSIESAGATRDAADWSAMQGAAPVAGRLALHPDDDPASLQFEEQIGSFAVRTCTDAARYRTVSRAFAAGDAESAWVALTRPAFDPRSVVVLEDLDATATDPRAEPDESAAVDVVEERTGRVRLRAHRTRPGWLLADIAWCPGWRATLDGAPVKLHCANYAFTALALPAGEHAIELEFAPAGVRIGSAISIIGLVLWSCMMFAAFSRARLSHRRAGHRRA
jgi:hypothetical protein